MKARHAGLILCLLTACGCVGPLVPVTPVDETAAAELARTVPVLELAETPKNATVMSPLTATSCQNKVWEPPASKDNALAQMRLQARSLGADAVGNVSCGPIEATNLAKNCWNSITCTGSAIKTVRR